MQYNFEWDPVKNQRNVQKHGISFELSTSIFTDPRALTIFDEEHSDSDERWITLGISKTGILIVAHHTFDETTEAQIRIRIFSARKASQKEHQQYRRL